MVHVKDLNHDAVIVRTLPDLLWSKRYHDVVFICKRSEEIQAHRLLLGAISPFLEHIFLEQAWRDIIHISLPDCDANDVQNVLRFAYEGVVRLDQEEWEEFIKIKQGLGINIPTDVINSNSGAIEDDKFDTRDQDVNVAQTGPTGTNIQQPTKRKCVEDLIHQIPHQMSPKKVNHGVIHHINNIVSNLSKPPVSEDVKKPRKDGNEKTQLLVPMKYLPKVLQIIETRKAEKRLEGLVEVCIKKYLTGLKKHKIKKNAKGVSNGFVPIPEVTSGLQQL